jgi:type VI secretion system secreted protein VgrG
VSTSGPTTITGDLGISPGLAGSITIIPPFSITGAIYAGGSSPDPVATLAQADVLTAYNALAGYGTATDLSGENLGNRTLSQGIYSSADATALLNGPLVLDAGGKDGAFWIFKLAAALTTGSANGSSVQVTNLGPNNGSDVGVFWLVGSTATLGTYTAFEGNILAVTSITLDPYATIENGRALALNAAVTLSGYNTISNVCPSPNNGPGFSGGLEFDDVTGEVVPVGGGTPVPAPTTIFLLGSGLLGLVFRKKKIV